jgi:hypothetical protein
LTDWAHGESFQHTVYHKPFKVNLTSTKKTTPPSYLGTLPEGVSLDKTMSVCRIQDTGNHVGKAGAVAPGIYTEYPGEGEAITLGFAPGKSYDSVGIGRHGNFMLWGWSASPSKMTPAGRKLFVNCICYIHQYDRKPHLRILRQAMPRDRFALLIDRMQQAPDRAETYLTRYFPSDIAKKYGRDLAGMRKYYETNIDVIHVRERRFCVDEDLKSLGIRSNRKVETIETLIERLDKKPQAQLARKCLTRYTQQTFESSEAWKQWYEENAQQLIFSDVGGYRFYTMP